MIGLKSTNMMCSAPKRNMRLQARIGYGGPDYHKPQRNLALDLVRVTESAAIGASRWLGKGDKYAADLCAVEEMRNMLNTIEMDGVVVIGEGEKDQSAMLYCGEKVGNSHHPLKMDIAVDPLDGTTLVAGGRDGACSVISLSPRGTLYDPRKAFYMEKLCVGPKVPPDMVSLDSSTEHNLKVVSACLRKPLSEVTVVILDRPRHADLIQECRDVGVRIKLISDGDVDGAISTCMPESGVDVLMGIGGSPEGVLAACALKILGGSIQARLWAKDDEELDRMEDDGYDFDKILHTKDLCKGNDIFFALTGVTDGGLVDGVRFVQDGATTHSIVMRSKSGTIRYITTHHHWNDLDART